MPSIIIIGASSGIGREVASLLAASGWQVGVAARREQPLRQLAAEYPGHVTYSVIDVTAADAGSRLTALAGSMGGCDVFLNVAGRGWYNPALDVDDDLATTAVNVDGFTRVMDAAYACCRSRGSGHIAAVTSAGGAGALGISAAYVSSKRYQWMYLDSLRQLARIDGVDLAVTDVRPGFVRTELLSRGPGRLPGTMEVGRVARAVVRAIERRRHVVYVDRRWRLLAALWRLLPRCVATRLVSAVSSRF